MRQAAESSGTDWQDWIALIVTAIGVVAGIIAFLRNERRLNRQETRQDQQEAEIQGFRQAANDQLERIADAVEALRREPESDSPSITSEDEGRATEAEFITKEGEKHGAELSARLEQRGRHKYSLVVTNRGPGRAQLLQVETSEDLLVGPTGVGDHAPVDLLPGETHRMIAAPSFGTSQMVDVHMRWLDSRGMQVRTQRISTMT